jgi:hypothetical protein
MARSENFMDTWEAYIRAFPDAEMFDSRGMSLEDFDRLEEMMETAIKRGSAMTEDDLTSPILEPDPMRGLVL